MSNIPKSVDITSSEFKQDLARRVARAKDPSVRKYSVSEAKQIWDKSYKDILRVAV